jgi:uncharacterized protein YfaT (DUF1175 family)
MGVSFSGSENSGRGQVILQSPGAAKSALQPLGNSADSYPMSWRDTWGDGFPDSARLDRFEDRENFIRWLTFLAESQFYGQSASAREEVQDCAALIRFAFRNALVAHSLIWRRAAALPYEPGFGDIVKFTYPKWPLGRGLFRIRPGPFSRADVDGSGFAEFADAETLLRYNSFRVSSNLQAARPGDLLFFQQATQRQPYHAMLFVGHSHFQPEGSDWIVYHTGELNGGRGEIREVQASLLDRHPDPHWRPLETNPHFLGVYRFALLR